MHSTINIQDWELDREKAGDFASFNGLDLEAAAEEIRISISLAKIRWDGGRESGLSEELLNPCKTFCNDVFGN